MQPPENYMPIKDITPSTERHWAAQVLVLEKSYPRVPMNSSTKFQRLILIDKQGSKVQATIFGPDIELFANTLKVFHKYKISNAIVAVVPPIHRIVPHTYQWTINRRTPIIEVASNEESDIAIPLQLVQLGALQKYLGTEELIDILAIVIYAPPQKEVRGSTVQEFILLNQELKPTTLTTWDQFISNEAACILGQLNDRPIILARHLKVSPYNGLSLSTKSSTTFVINPELAEADALRSWAAENEDTINQVQTITETSYNSNTSTSVGSSDISKATEIAATASPGHRFKLRGTASVVNSNQKFWYMCCNNCHKGIDANYERQFSCVNCNKVTTAAPRCRIEVQLEDPSGLLTAVIFGHNAEKLFTVTALNLMSNTEEVERLKSMTMKEEHLFLIAAVKNEYRQQSGTKFIIIAVDDDIYQS